jgi:cytoskeletal protein CcmA (bactofilin family)
MRQLVIHGKGSATGGKFEKVAVYGSAKVDGDVETDDLQSHGESTFVGDVKAGSATVKGATKIEGNCETVGFKVGGAVSVLGRVSSKELGVEGVLTADKDVAAEEASIRGGLKVGGNWSGESLKVKGAFSIGGLLNVGVLDAEIYGQSTAKEIGGERITVRRKRAGKFTNWLKSVLLQLDTGGGLHTSVIEGDEVYLEATKAEVVRGAG